MIEENLIDLNLNVKNAKERGFEYVGDVIYEEEKFMREIKELLINEGYRLGRAGFDDDSECYGIYRPI
jgi:hypothetical protein